MGDDKHGFENILKAIHMYTREGLVFMVCKCYLNIVSQRLQSDITEVT